MKEIRKEVELKSVKHRRMESRERGGNNRRKGIGERQSDEKEVNGRTTLVLSDATVLCLLF